MNKMSEFRKKVLMRVSGSNLDTGLLKLKKKYKDLQVDVLTMPRSGNELKYEDDVLTDEMIVAIIQGKDVDLAVDDVRKLCHKAGPDPDDKYGLTEDQFEAKFGSSRFYKDALFVFTTDLEDL